MNVTSFGYASDAGASRDRNEDNFCVIPEIGLWAVADGMGGYKGGKTASAITIERLSNDIRNGVPLSESILNIHGEILQLAESTPENEGMGSTVVVLKTNGCHYEIAWVGDSRAYLWNGNSLRQITRDHSVIQHLMDEGVITEKDAVDHPQRHAIYQALGGMGLEKVNVDEVYGIFNKNEKILLCSDGLTTELDDQRITSILSKEPLPQAAVESLIDAANRHGGSDNITVILVSAPDDALPREMREDTVPLEASNTVIVRPKKSDRLARWMMSLIFLVAFIMMVFLWR